MGARLFVLTDASFGGNIYGFGRSILQGDVSMNSRLFVKGDVSMNSRLFVTSDVSMGGRLFVGGDVSMNSRLFLTSDASFGARLFVKTDASFGGNMFIANNLFLGVSGNPYQVDLSGVINLRGTVNPITLIDDSVLLTNTPPLDFSNNYGSAWTPIYGITDETLNSISMSANGQYQTIVTTNASNLGFIYTSADYGFSWKKNTTVTNKFWTAVSISANGKYQSATVYLGNIWTNNNYGLGSWTEYTTGVTNYSSNNGTFNSVLSTQYWLSISMSSTGQYQTAISNTFPGNNSTFGGDLYISSNYGSSWDIGSSLLSGGQTGPTGLPGYNPFNGIAMSSTGQYQATVVYKNFIYVSNDFGKKWISVTNTAQQFFGISMSSSGQYISAVTSTMSLSLSTSASFMSSDRGTIFISSNYGLTWNDSAVNNYWNAITMTANGQYQTAVVNNSAKTYSGLFSIVSGSNLVSTLNTLSYPAIILGSAVSGTGIPTGTVVTSNPVLANGNNIYQFYISNNVTSTSITATLTFQSGSIYSSSNYGVTWYDNTIKNTNGISNTMNQLWQSQGIAMSANGQYQTALAGGVGGYIYTSMTPYQQVLISNNLTVMSGDTTIYTRLFVINDVSMTSRLFVTSDVSLNARLFVGGDASYNGNLYTLSRTIKQGDVSMNSRLFVNGDVSMNSRLFITSDVSMNARLFVSGDVSLNGNLYTLGRTIQKGDVSMNSRLFINGDVSMNSRLFVTSDVSLSARLFVSGDASYNGNLYTLGRTILQGDVSMNSRLFINGDVSMNSRLFITSDVSMNARLFVSGDVSLNANLYVLGRTIQKGDVSMNSRLFINGDVSLNSRLFVTSDVSMNARLFVSGDVSMNGNLYNLGRTICQGDVSMNARLFVFGNIALGTNNPTSTLDIVGNTRITQATQSTSALALYNATNAVNTVNMHPYLNTGSFNNMTALYDSGLFWGNAQNSATGGFVIAPWVNATTGLRIANTGNVSINTTTNTSTLNVGGSATFTTSLSTPALNATSIELGAYATDAGPYIDFKNNNTWDYNARIQLTGGSSNAVNGTLTYTAGLHSFTNGNVTVGVNNASTSTTTGSLQVTGGAGISGNLYAANLYSSNGLYLSGWNQPLINGSSTPPGSYVGWNYTNSGGETNFVNCKGTGGGGFSFYNIASNASGILPLPVVTISGVGDASFNGNVSIGGTLNVNQLKASSTIMYTNVVSSTVYSLVVNEDATFGNTTSPTASLTAAALSATYGGVYVNKNLRVDGSIYLQGTGSNGVLYTSKLNNGGDLTLPTSSGTLATQDYVTGQSYITSSSLTGYALKAGATFTGQVAITGAATGTVLLVGTSAAAVTNYLVVVNGNVQANAYNATSDMRIKTNMSTINGTYAVEVLRKLEPKKYSYIDDKEDNYTWGFIGQELESCLDYSTTKSTNYIPNIYDNADISNKRIILSSKSTKDFIVESLNDISLSKMRFLDSKKNEIIRNIDKIINDNTFSITETIDTSDNKIFVYGQLVDDFYSVNHTSVFTITTAAVKEIDRELQSALLVIEEQNKKIQKLTDEMDELKTIVKSLIK